MKKVEALVFALCFSTPIFAQDSASRTSNCDEGTECCYESGYLDGYECKNSDPKRWGCQESKSDYQDGFGAGDEDREEPCKDSQNQKDQGPLLS